MPHAVARRVVEAGWRGAPAIWRMADVLARRPQQSRVALRGGLSLCVESGDYVSDLVYAGLYERAHRQLVASLLDGGDTAVDVGANIGYLTALMAEAVGTAGRVLAVEPGPPMLSLLRESFAEVQQVTVLGHALGGSEGTGRLEVPDPTQLGLSSLRGNQGGDAVAVRVRPLDAVLQEHGVADVALLKVDVEGYEEEVFRGASDLVRGHAARAVLAEVTPSFGDVGWATDLLADLGSDYRCFEIRTQVSALRVRCLLVPCGAAKVRALDRQTDILVVRADGWPRVRRFAR